MFGLGRPSVSEEMRGWLCDGLVWCARAGLLRPDTPVVVPTSAFFPAPGGDTEVVAEGLLANMLRIVGLEGAAIEMQPIEVLPDALRHRYGAVSEVAGTWSSDGNASVIRYDPTLLRRPVTFLSMLAHEVMHDVLHRHAADWPGGEAVEELMTDLGVIACGMGAIQMAGAEEAGWQGYLRQESRAHATALVLTATAADPSEALAHLPPRAAKALKAALREVGRTDAAAPLVRAIPDAPLRSRA